MKPIYKCAKCGNVVELLHKGGGQLSCCGAPMDLLEANTVDASFEKHIPVVEVSDEGVTVTVGSVLHPSTPEHYIEWIEIIHGDGKSSRHFLNPGDVPQVVCKCGKANCDCGCRDKDIKARCYCNLHGLWE